MLHAMEHLRRVPGCVRRTFSSFSVCLSPFCIYIYPSDNVARPRAATTFRIILRYGSVDRQVLPETHIFRCMPFHIDPIDYPWSIAFSLPFSLFADFPACWSQHSIIDIHGLEVPCSSSEDSLFEPPSHVAGAMGSESFPNSPALLVTDAIGGSAFFPRFLSRLALAPGNPLISHRTAPLDDEGAFGAALAAVANSSHQCACSDRASRAAPGCLSLKCGVAPQHHPWLWCARILMFFMRHVDQPLRQARFPATGLCCALAQLAHGGGAPRGRACRPPISAGMRAS